MHTYTKAQSYYMKALSPYKTGKNNKKKTCTCKLAHKRTKNEQNTHKHAHAYTHAHNISHP